MLYYGLFGVFILVWTLRLLRAGVSNGTSILKSDKRRAEQWLCSYEQVGGYSNPEEASVQLDQQ